MACQYVFQGKTYNKRSILNAIKDGDVVLGDIQTARENIRKILNMNDSEIELVRGLIDNDAVGAFTQDGRILLSDRFVQGEEYHEAFHRVFRTVFSDAQRKALFKEYRNREGFQESLDQKRKLYPNQSTEELIEEVLADEFMMYQLADGNYVVPKPIQNAFQRILNFIRKLLGLKDIAGVYEAIRAGNYKSVKPKFYRGEGVANSKLKVGKFELGTYEKNEIVEGVVANFGNSFLEEVAATGSFENIDIDKHLVEAVEGVINSLRNRSSNGLRNLAIAVETSTIVYEYDEEGETLISKSLNANSPIIIELRKRLDQLKIKTIVLDTASGNVKINEEVLEHEESNDEDSSTNDYAFMKASWETNPEDNITAAMKILAASTLSQERSESFLLPKLEKYNTVVMSLFKILKNAPHNWDVVKSLLENHVDKYAWISPMIDRLNRNLKLRTQFMQSFVKAHYEMYNGVWSEEELQMHTLDDETKFMSDIRNIQDYVNTLPNKNRVILSTLLDPTASKKDVFAALTNIELPDALINSKILTTGGFSSVEDMIDNIATITKDNIKAGVPYSNLFDKNVIRPKDILKTDNSILGTLRRILKEYNKYRPNEQGVVLNHNRDRIWPWTTHTYQKQVESALNLVANLTSKELDAIPLDVNISTNNEREIKKQKRTVKLRELLPWFVNYEFNFYEQDGLIKTNSLILNRILEGDEYSLSIFSGLRFEEGTDAKDLLAPDMIPVYIKSIMGLEPKYVSIKHGDRGSIFTGGFESKADYTKDKQVNAYLSSLLLDEIRIVSKADKYSIFKNMGDKKLKLFEFLNISTSELNKLVSDYNNNKLDANELLIKYSKSFDAHLRNIVNDFKELLKEVYSDNNGRPLMHFVKSGNSFVQVPIYITQEMYSSMSNVSPENRLNALIENVVSSYLIHFYEDVRVFVGYAGEYPNMVNLFKRIQSLSSSGKPLANDQSINSYVDSLNQKDSYSVVINDQVIEKTYGDRNLKQQGKIKEKVLIGPRTSYTQEEKDSLAAIHKANLIQEGFPEKIAEQRAKEWVSVFNEYEEADGVTYTNMFFYREYKIRLGEWNENMENTFQIELAILNQGTTNPELYVTKDGRIYANQPQGIYDKVRIFDIKKNFTQSFIFDKLEPFTMLKPVYTGPVEHEAKNEEGKLVKATVNGIRKTAFHVILPSMVFNTDKLKKIHDYMLINNVDMIPLDSAAKKAVPKNVENIKAEVFSNSPDTFTILDSAYLKEQVKMSNKEKGKIKNATQSTTIMLTNLFVEDFTHLVDKTVSSFSKPKDYRGKVPFIQLTEEEKIAQSPIYKKYTAYKTALDNVVNLHMSRVKEELGIVNDAITNINTVVEVLKRNIEIPSVSDALDYVAEAKSLDLLPSFNRIEPALFSIVSNEAIRIKRPGEMLAQYSVYGMDEVTEPGVKSKRLQNYRIVDGVVKPAEVILPLPKSMVNTLMSMTNTTSVIGAISAYNQGSSKITVKGLRIPNQQLSFNGIYEIKKFALPTMQNYIVLPSEIVPVSSTDFDIDKQQVYFPVLNSSGNMVMSGEAGLYNKLLQAEIDLLLDPANFHTLMTPVNEAWFSKDLFKDILIKRGEYTAEQLNSDEKLENAVIKFTFKEIGNIASQIRTAINMTQSKLNVGLMATNAKMYPVSQIDGWKANLKIVKSDGTELANTIPIVGDKKHFYALTDSKFRHITESISTLMTSQLDGVKNPYAVALNIVKNSIGPLMLMVRRGIDVDLAVKIIASPVVARYNLATNLFKSTTAKSRGIYAKGPEGENNVLEHMYDSYGMIEKFLEQFRKGQTVINEQDINNALKDKSLNSDASYKVLAAYMYTEELADEMLELSMALTPDTKPLSNMVSSDLMNQRYNTFETSLREGTSVISNDVRNGFLKSFFDAQRLYSALSNLYFTRKDKGARYLVTNLAAKATAGVRSTEGNIRARNTFVNDFKAYMFFKKLKVKHGDKYSFNNIMVSDSIIKDINAILVNEEHPGYDNYFIRNVFPVTNVATAPDSKTNINLLKVKGRGNNQLHLYDLYQDFQELVDSTVGTEYEASTRELVRKLIAYNIYTTGFGFSPFTLDDAVSPKLINELYNEIDFYNMNVTLNDINEFINFFVAANPNIYRFKIKPKKDEVNIFASARYKKRTLTVGGRIQGIVGNSYAKRYDSKVPEYLTITVPRGTQAQVQPTPATEQQIPDELKCSTPGPKAEEGMSFGFTPGSNWEIIKDFKGPSHEYGGIDIMVQGGTIRMSNKEGDVKAPDGLVMPRFLQSKRRRATEVAQASVSTPAMTSNEPVDNLTYSVDLPAVEVTGRIGGHQSVRFTDYEQPAHVTAIKKYQIEQGLKPTGAIDSETRKLLGGSKETSAELQEALKIRDLYKSKVKEEGSKYKAGEDFGMKPRVYEKLKKANVDQLSHCIGGVCRFLDEKIEPGIFKGGFTKKGFDEGTYFSNTSFEEAHRKEGWQKHNDYKFTTPDTGDILRVNYPITNRNHAMLVIDKKENKKDDKKSILTVIDNAGEKEARIRKFTAEELEKKYNAGVGDNIMRLSFYRRTKFGDKDIAELQRESKFELPQEFKPYSEYRPRKVQVSVVEGSTPEPMRKFLKGINTTDTSKYTDIPGHHLQTIALISAGLPKGESEEGAGLTYKAEAASRLGAKILRKVTKGTPVSKTLSVGLSQINPEMLSERIKEKYFKGLSNTAIERRINRDEELQGKVTFDVMVDRYRMFRDGGVGRYGDDPSQFWYALINSWQNPSKALQSAQKKEDLKNYKWDYSNNIINNLDRFKVDLID